jgi:hypothetical protein
MKQVKEELRKKEEPANRIINEKMRKQGKEELRNGRSNERRQAGRKEINKSK